MHTLELHLEEVVKAIWFHISYSICVFVCVCVRLRARMAGITGGPTQGKKTDVVTPSFASLLCSFSISPSLSFLPVLSPLSVSLPSGTVMDGRLRG